MKLHKRVQFRRFVLDAKLVILENDEEKKVIPTYDIREYTIGNDTLIQNHIKKISPLFTKL